MLIDDFLLKYDVQVTRKPCGLFHSRRNRLDDASRMKISALYYYPIKSCKGTLLERAIVGKKGIQNDRVMMVVDPAGVFLTQREHHRMALIAPRVQGDTLTLTAPEMPPLTIARTSRGKHVAVTVWRDHCAAIDQGDVVAAWLSDFLTTPCRLVHVADDAVRQVDQTYARRAEDQVGFADGFPFHVISEASLDDLNTRLEMPLEINRFRPNIVVSGCAPFAEDRWKRIQLGEIVLDLVKPCARCVITTVDQSTAESDQEPLRTLATYRKQQRKVMFGQNAIHTNVGIICVGAQVQVLVEA